MKVDVARKVDFEVKTHVEMEVEAEMTETEVRKEEEMRKEEEVRKTGAASVMLTELATMDFEHIRQGILFRCSDGPMATLVGTA